MTRERAEQLIGEAVAFMIDEKRFYKAVVTAVTDAGVEGTVFNAEGEALFELIWVLGQVEEL